MTTRKNTKKENPTPAASSEFANLEHRSACRWEPIRDYESSADSRKASELVHIAEVWAEYRAELEKNGRENLNQFNEKLQREWAIETGLLERIYTLDRGITEILIERGISADYISSQNGLLKPERVVQTINAHKNAIEGLFDFVSGNRKLTPGYIKQLHAELTGHQDTVSAVDAAGNPVEIKLLRGEYKKQPNNPRRHNGVVHEYCPPEHVASEMDNLLNWHHSHAQLPLEVRAAWLHHRFTQIHPFQDGNGRMARCLATLAFIKEGCFPLVIRDTKDERGRYLDALEQADSGDLNPLVRLFVTCQKRAFAQAMGISQQILKHGRVDQIIGAAVEALKEREKILREEWNRAKKISDHLQTIAEERLTEVSDLLRKQTEGLFKNPEFRVDGDRDGGSRGYYFRRQIIETAKRLDYYANLGEYRAWSRLVLRAESQSEIVLSFHAIGHEFRGVLAVSACFFRRAQTEEGEREIADITPLVHEIFQINYREKSQDVADRFGEWLEEILTGGLEMWRRGL